MEVDKDVLGFVDEPEGSQRGHLVIVDRFINPNLPEVWVTYWPIARDVYKPDFETLLGHRMRYSGNDGVYQDLDAYTFRFWQLEDGGKTKPLRFDTEPIPPPKTKLQTRWYHGCWQVLTRAGWRDRYV